MELLLAVIIWPFLVLSIGLVSVAFFGDFGRGYGYGLLSFLPLLLLALAGLFIVLASTRKMRESLPGIKQLAMFRNWVITLSIAVILPIFIKYIVSALNGSFGAVLMGLVIGFVIILWGMFLKVNSVIMYGNLFGGALILVYIFFQLGNLGEGARIFAAAIGLVFAIFVAVFKLKDKLT